MFQCGRCYNGNNCLGCYYGYGLYLDLKDTLRPVEKCRLCKDAIPGCLTCEKIQKCDQCYNPYIVIDGICYEQDGKTIAGKGKSDGGSSTADG